MKDPRRDPRTRHRDVPIHRVRDALSTLDDALEIRCFKRVDHEITFVDKRLWPALAKLAQVGVVDAERVTSIQQQHMPTPIGSPTT